MHWKDNFQTMKIKVCGIRRLSQVYELKEMGVHYAGFIFYERSPRFAGEVLDAGEIKAITGIEKTGVFVDAAKEEIRKIVDSYGLTLVQLHGDESVEECLAVKAFAPVIKAFRIGEDTNINELVRPYIGACDLFLFDTAGPLHGGNGKQFNWQLLDDYREGPPFLLSGGIAPEMKEAVRAYHHPLCMGIDINSRFETEPGVKNINLIKDFVWDLNII